MKQIVLIGSLVLLWNRAFGQDFQRDTISLSENASIEIVKDSCYHKFQYRPDLTRVYLTDSTDIPSSIIVVDEEGTMISLHQNGQNEIRFGYDSETGELEYLMYRTNSGRVRRVKKVKN